MKLNKILKLSAFTLLCTSSIMAAMGDNMTAGIGVTLGNTVQEQTWMDNSQYQDSVGNGPLAGVSVGSTFALSDAATSATVFDFRNTYYQRVKTNAVGITAQHKLKTAEGSIHGVYGGVDYTSYDSMNFWQGALGAETMMLGYKGSLNFYIPFGGTATYSGISGSTMTGLYGVDLSLGKMIDMFGLGAQASYFWNDDIKNNISAFSFGGEYTFAKNMLTTGAAYQYRNGLDSTDYGYKVFARVPLHKGTFSGLTGMNSADSMASAMLYKPVNRMVGGVLQAKDIDCSAVGGSSYSIGGVTSCSTTGNPFDSLQLKSGMNLSESNAGVTITGKKTLSGLNIIDRPTHYKDGLTVQPGTIIAFKGKGSIIANASSDTGGVIIGSAASGSKYVTLTDASSLLKTLTSKESKKNPHAQGIVSVLKKVGVRAQSNYPTGKPQSPSSSPLGSDITDNNHGVGLITYGKAKMFLSDSSTEQTGRPDLLKANKIQSNGGRLSQYSTQRPDFFNLVVGSNIKTTASTGSTLASTVTAQDGAAAPATAATIATQGSWGSKSLSLPKSADSNQTIPTTEDFATTDTIGDGKVQVMSGLLQNVTFGGGIDDVNKGHAAVLNKVIVQGRTIGNLGSNFLADKLFMDEGKGAHISQMGGFQQITNSAFTAGSRTTSHTDSRNGVIHTHTGNLYDSSNAAAMFTAHKFAGKSSNVSPRYGMVTRLANGELSASADDQSAAKNIIEHAPRFTSINNYRKLPVAGSVTFGVGDLNGVSGAGTFLSEVGSTYDGQKVEPVDMNSAFEVASNTRGLGGQIGQNKTAERTMPIAFTDVAHNESPSFSGTGRKLETFATDFNANAGTADGNVTENISRTAAQLIDNGLSAHTFTANEIMLAQGIDTKFNMGKTAKSSILRNALGFGNGLAPAKYMLSQLDPTGANDTGFSAQPKLQVEKINFKPLAATQANPENTASANGTFYFSGVGGSNKGIDLTTGGNARASYLAMVKSSAEGLTAASGGIAGSTSVKGQEFANLTMALQPAFPSGGTTMNNGTDGGAKAFQTDTAKPALVANAVALSLGLNQSGSNNQTLSTAIDPGTSNFSDGTKTTLQKLTGSDQELEDFFSHVVTFKEGGSTTNYSSSDIASMADFQKLGMIKSLGTDSTNRSFIKAMKGFNTQGITSTNGTSIIEKVNITSDLSNDSSSGIGANGLITGHFPIGHKAKVYALEELGASTSLYEDKGTQTGNDPASSTVTTAGQNTGMNNS